MTKTIQRIWIIIRLFTRRKVFNLYPSKPLLKYLTGGVGAFLLEYSSFYGLYYGLKWPLYVANSFSFILGLLTSFSLNRLWTFRHKSYHKKTGHQFSLYVGLALTNLLLTNILVQSFVHFGINPKIGKLVAMVITSVWNYALFKMVIFAQHKTEPTKLG
jgi:putative flippase GtrA